MVQVICELVTVLRLNSFENEWLWSLTGYGRPVWSISALLLNDLFWLIDDLILLLDCNLLFLDEAQLLGCPVLPDHGLWGVITSQIIVIRDSSSAKLVSFLLIKQLRLLTLPSLQTFEIGKTSVGLGELPWREHCCIVLDRLLWEGLDFEFGLVSRYLLQRWWIIGNCAWLDALNLLVKLLCNLICS